MNQEETAKQKILIKSAEQLGVETFLNTSGKKNRNE